MTKYSEKYKLMYKIMHETENPENKFISISGIRNSDLNSYGSKLIIPSEIEGIPVKRIGPSAFVKNPNIVEVEIMEGTTFIDTSAFEAMDKLEKITFPKTLRVIGPDAFYNCLRLKQVDVQEGLEKIFEFAFNRCSITNFYFPESLIFIGNNAFTLSKLENIKFGDNLTSIGRRAFSSSENLESVTFGNGLKNISTFAFINCSKLKDFTIPDSVVSVDEQFIEGCTSLETLHIGANTILSNDSVGFAFGCKSLREITVSPKNERYKIIKGILYDTKNKSLIVVPAKLDVRNVVVPKWVKTISPFCFADNENIRTIRFNSDEINGIEELCSPDESKVKIICNPDSKICKFAERNGFQTGQMISELDSFLSSCIDDEKDTEKQS